MDLFTSRWQTYRSVVDNDWMEHRAMTAACADALESWMAGHPERHRRAHLVDLGCGDLARMGPVFRALPLGSYTGVDITAQVLPMAREALGPVPYTTRFQCGDVAEFIDGLEHPVDLTHAALVLHHLDDDAKIRFLAGLREKTTPGGIFVWADVFCDPDETRTHYAARYAARIREGWREIDTDAREAIVAHMQEYDFPADRGQVVTVAEDSGWRWRWIWQGSHRAEAVAVLTAS